MQDLTKLIKKCIIIIDRELRLLERRQMSTKPGPSGPVKVGLSNADADKLIAFSKTLMQLEKAQKEEDTPKDVEDAILKEADKIRAKRSEADTLKGGDASTSD